MISNFNNVIKDVGEKGMDEMINKEEKIIIVDPIDLFYLALGKHQDDGFSILGSYDTVFYIVNSAINEGYDLVYAEFEDEEIDGYDKGFYVTFSHDGEIWIEKAYRSKYVNGLDKNLYVEDVYADEYLKSNKNSEFYVFGFDEEKIEYNETDDDGTCICVDDDGKGFTVCIHDDESVSSLFGFEKEMKV